MHHHGFNPFHGLFHDLVLVGLAFLMFAAYRRWRSGRW